MPRDSRVDDVGTHGPKIIQGSPNVIDEGKPSARVGDLYACPIHGPNPILTGSAKTIVNNKRNARVTSVTLCGAVIISGAAKCITD